MLVHGRVTETNILALLQYKGIWPNLLKCAPSMGTSFAVCVLFPKTRPSHVLETACSSISPPPRRRYEASKDLLDQYFEDKVDVDDEILEEE